jgi:hypothetical protein
MQKMLHRAAQFDASGGASEGAKVQYMLHHVALLHCECLHSTDCRSEGQLKYLHDCTASFTAINACGFRASFDFGSQLLLSAPAFGLQCM